MVVNRDGERRLYNLDAHRWQRLESESPIGPVRDIVYWQSTFWIGGEKGLFRFTPGGNGAAFELLANGTNGTQTAVQATDVPGQVIDLEANPTGGLYILTQRPCDATPGLCVWLGQRTSRETSAVALVDQQNYYPDV